MKRFALSLLMLCPMPLAACELALVLAVDVSGSVDSDEYAIQMGGLAQALRDGIVADALVGQSAAVTLVQWTGSSRQKQTIPWATMRSYADVITLADQIDQDPRIWRNYSTAIGEALSVSLDLYEQVPQCARKVIDVSGDGVSNEGVAPDSLRAKARAAGVIVNALAIETDQADLTAYFYENLIVGEGAFVATAAGFDDYPAQIKRKLQRETTKQVTQVDGDQEIQ